LAETTAPWEGLTQISIFVADVVLAKHDENYMPPEVADALKAAEDAAKARTNKI